MPPTFPALADEVCCFLDWTLPFSLQLSLQTPNQAFCIGANSLKCLTFGRLPQALKLDSELIPTHRLDEGTEGVVVIARTSEFASYFQTLLKRSGAHSEPNAMSYAPLSAKLVCSFLCCFSASH